MIAGGTAMTHSDSTRPNTIPWPPILFVGAALAAVVLGHYAPLPDPFGALAGGVSRGIGILLALFGFGLDIWAIVTMARKKTAVAPNRPATHLVTDGPFRYSRNPIYLGNMILMTGLALALSNMWFIVAGLAAGISVDRLAIRREEAHLAARFGDEWLAYRDRIGRWIGRHG